MLRKLHTTWEMSHVITNQITQLCKKARTPSIERMSYFFCQKEKDMRKKGETGVQARTKPKPMQKKEKRSVRRKSLPDLNDNDPDKLTNVSWYSSTIVSNSETHGLPLSIFCQNQPCHGKAKQTILLSLLAPYLLSCSENTLCTESSILP